MAHQLELRGVTTEDTYHHDSLSFTDTRRTVLEGQLAQRIRRRFGLASAEKVWLKERNWEGGTDCTRETHTEFVVGCASAAVTFHPDSDGTWWTPGSRRDSVYARFDAWLDAALRDARLWDAWTDETGREQSNNFVSIPIHLDSVLGAAAKAYGRERLSQVYLWGERDRGSAAPAWSWELHTIAERGHRSIITGNMFYPRVATIRMEEPTRTAAATKPDRRRILLQVTDQLMPGRAGY